jgi:hypothetical protein
VRQERWVKTAKEHRMTLAWLAEAVLATGLTLPVVAIDLELDAGAVSRTALYTSAVTFVVADNRSRRSTCGHCQDGCTKQGFADDVHECLHFYFGQRMVLKRFG